MKNSKQKEIVLRVLGEHKIHPTADELYRFIHQEYTDIGVATVYRNLNKLADELYRFIHQEYTDIGVATVYRNLNKLAEEGIIKKIVGLDGSSHFDSCIEPHFHFICGCCGKIYDVPDNVGMDFIAKAEEFTDCKITSMDILFRGYCRECAEKHSFGNLFAEKEMNLISCVT